MTLDYVKSSPELVQRMINEGHEVGNHSCTHPSLPDISDDMVFEEIHGLETYISDNFGGYKTVTMRPPRGEFSVRTLRIAKIWVMILCCGPLRTTTGIRTLSPTGTRRTGE